MVRLSPAGSTALCDSTHAHHQRRVEHCGCGVRRKAFQVRRVRQGSGGGGNTELGLGWWALSVTTHPRKEYVKNRKGIINHFTSFPHARIGQNAIRDWNVYKDATTLENATSEDYVTKHLRLTKASRGGGAGPNRCSCWLWPWPLDWLAGWAG